ncbi:MAG: hypothetical protein FIA94_05620 [Nitrospirae bacterium]|nr:hypothetical protein [Nitrospirota bacterium]
MKLTSLAGRPNLVVSMNEDFSRLLNLIESRLRRKEVALAEEFAAELLEKTMDLLLLERASRMNRLNRFLSSVIKLLMVIVCASLLLMVLNVQPLLGLKIFTAGYIMIALLMVANYYLFQWFYRSIHVMIETYKKESKRFTALLIDSVDDNPETALNMFCLAMTQ